MKNKKSKKKNIKKVKKIERKKKGITKERDRKRHIMKC